MQVRDDVPGRPVLERRRLLPLGRSEFTQQCREACALLGTRLPTPP